MCSVFNRSIMSDIQRDNRVVSLSSRAGIRNSLVTILDQLQRCQKSLNEFLEVHTCIEFLCAKTIYIYISWVVSIKTFLCLWLLQEKRSAFPRFYFIGDDDLLEILGQATNPTVIQSHLKKLFAGQKPLFWSICSSHVVLFIVLLLLLWYPLYHGICLCIIWAGIHSVRFDEQCQHIVAMCSLEGEIVPLRNLIRISSLVEVKPLCRIVCECIHCMPCVGCTVYMIEHLKHCMYVYM